MERSVRTLAIAMTAATLLAASCNEDSLEPVRNATYPSDFHYITRGEIRGTMQQLASELYALDSVLSRDGGPGPEDREEVVAILARMRDQASSLKQRQYSNHPRIDAFAPRLRHNIIRALGAAKEDPPNYYFAGRVAGSCAYCHASSPSKNISAPAEHPVP